MAEGGTQQNGGARGVGLRQNGDRRTHSRRRSLRFGPERRLSDRRKKQLSGLLLAAATLAAPMHARKPLALGKTTREHTRSVLEPKVSVLISEFKAGKPEDLYEPLIQEAAATYGVPANLIRAVMRAESAFDPRAESHVGAQGLMQLMPPLAREMGVTDPFDPRQNVMAGAKYLRKMLDLHSGNVKLALASYNAGPTNVRRYKGIPPFKETRNYVKKITGFLEEEASATQE